MISHATRATLAPATYLFDVRVLAALKDSKPRSFTALLSEVGFSHNILQQHLKHLMAQGLIVREKANADSFGRPKFAYHAPPSTTKQVSLTLQNPHVELVPLPFSPLRHVCRFEKGDHRKETRRECAPKIRRACIFAKDLERIYWHVYRNYITGFRRRWSRQ